MSTLDVLMLVVAAGLTVVALLQLRAALGVYRGAARRRPRNVSGEHRQPPLAVAPLLTALALLGFRRLGEVELTMPELAGLGPLLGRQTTHTVWLLVDGPETTLAEVVDIGPMLSLETSLADNSIVQTAHPQGEDIAMPGLRATAVAASPADAYEHHRRMIDARSTSAPPLDIHSVGEYLRRDADYRQRFASLYLRPAVIRRQVLPTLFLLLVAGGLAVTVLRSLAQ